MKAEQHVERTLCSVPTIRILCVSTSHQTPGANDPQSEYTSYIAVIVADTNSSARLEVMFVYQGTCNVEHLVGQLAASPLSAGSGVKLCWLWSDVNVEVRSDCGAYIWMGLSETRLTMIVVLALTWRSS